MKHSKLLSAVPVALLGLSAAAVMMPAGIAAGAANEQTFTYYDCEYSYVPGSGEATLIKYTGTNPVLQISGYVPSPDGWKTVTKIEGYVVHNTTVNPGSMYPSLQPMVNLTTVWIPSSVREICNDAFKNCTTIQSVDFSYGLQTIGSSAFENCDQITSLAFPATLQTIGGFAFYDCDSLTTVSLPGSTYLEYNAFDDCDSLASVQLSQTCQAEEDAFSNCPSLNTVNGTVPWNYNAYYNNHTKPCFAPSNPIRNVLKNCFAKSKHTKFTDDFCAAYCEYVVSTETRSWMGEATKARQLYKWLVEHCEYEDELNGEKLGDPENHTAQGFFISLGLYTRGTEIGESVCEGYAKAYTMLLTQAGIESYVLDASLTALGRQMYPGSGGHSWNLVKVGGKFYQCDATWDDSATLSYTFFLKNRAAMETLHSCPQGLLFNSPSVNATPDVPNYHYTLQAGKAGLNQCIYNFSDGNSDGILDSDFDFDGNANTWIDNYILSRIAAGDMNFDGQITELDAYLAQIFYANPTHETWLAICMAIFPG